LNPSCTTYASTEKPVSGILIFKLLQLCLRPRTTKQSTAAVFDQFFLAQLVDNTILVHNIKRAGLDSLFVCEDCVYFLLCVYMLYLLYCWDWKLPRFNWPGQINTPTSGHIGWGPLRTEWAFTSARALTVQTTRGNLDAQRFAPYTLSSYRTLIFRVRSPLYSL